MKQTAVFILGVSFCFFAYWMSGGDFQRSTSLGMTTMISPIIGALCLVFAEIIDFMYNAPKEE